MNGRLHLGHAYSMTKSEFTARFKKITGHNTLFPFSFHCTGMPIMASADRLKLSFEKFAKDKDISFKS
jgi:leucyl-tRNA synthetase